MHTLGIDVYTKDKAYILRRLRRLVSTDNAVDGGVYRADPVHSQIHMTTTKSLTDVEDWFYNTPHVECAGVFNRDV